MEKHGKPMFRYDNLNFTASKPNMIFIIIGF